MTALMKARIIVGLGALAIATIACAAIAAISTLTLLRPAPEVRFTALSGETFSTSGLRGKVVLVNFWASYCGSCVREMLRIADTHAKFAPRGYETIAVAVSKDDPARVASFARAHVLPFPVVIDDGTAAKQFGNVRLTPTTFLIDKQGRVLRRYVGEPDWAELHRLVEKALENSI